MALAYIQVINTGDMTMTDETAGLHKVNEGLAEALAAKQSLLADAASDRDRLREINAELLEALKTIAGGRTANFPGAPDVMEITPEAFSDAMWSWSQKVARAAITRAEAGK